MGLFLKSAASSCKIHRDKIEFGASLLWSLRMKHLRLFGFIFLVGFIFASPLFAQMDDVSSATGMPIPIGAPVIYGQVSIEGMPRGERRPIIFVSLLLSGTQIDRRPTDDRGYFFFLQEPRHGHSLLFEVDSSEVGRAYLTIGIGNRIRQDVSVDWRSLRGTSATKAGVLPANSYPRDADAEKAFNKAMAAVKENKNGAAITLFKEMLVKDPKDYLVWTMLGTIYYSDKNFDDAAPAFTTALELKPEFMIARLNFGKMELGQKHFDKAIAILSRAVELEPGSADANQYLGEAYLQAKKGSLAVGFLNKAIELAPVQKAELHLRLAALYNGAGLKDRASTEYKLFLEKVPNHADKAKFEQYIKDNSPK